MPNLTQIALATGFGLILIGFYGALTRRSLLRIILAFTLASTGVNVVIVAIGYMRGRTAPILDEAVTTTRPVAIDLDAEKQKLAQLRKQQARLNKQAAPAVAQCKALYPQ